MQDRQRKIEEKEQAMMIQLEEEKQQLADEAKAALEENIREQRRLGVEEKACLEEELARIPAEEQARAELAEKITAEELSKNKPIELNLNIRQRLKNSNEGLVQLRLDVSRRSKEPTLKQSENDWLRRTL
ncbi:uncharacterized protein MELLADRAFT_61718 [Melampsora larici-populina 98AG31]|uniref:Uncharacterized protein n=1 Tax=Melampsora larici-populina (strain 98AG31 / pathotype 3-4-7) TaxID=747676 RepID=F4RGA9_MELLP|nr:uncharacterized protein MELLADRAFT_61718 [Melampsora larici-populina 98AG31]EGG08441.1 hypothetical protein MELLADRAFT_61718 [Melampsora larici-populina 98AG31]